MAEILALTTKLGKEAPSWSLNFSVFQTLQLTSTEVLLKKNWWRKKPFLINRTSFFAFQVTQKCYLPTEKSPKKFRLNWWRKKPFLINRTSFFAFQVTQKCRIILKFAGQKEAHICTILAKFQVNSSKNVEVMAKNVFSQCLCSHYLSGPFSIVCILLYKYYS